nr:type II toxin-antitoxin system RelE/ParE family toxin [Nakamurella aerolata]
MERVRNGATHPGDVKHLRGEICEVRSATDGVYLRVLYAKVKGQAVLLALSYQKKKSRTTPTGWIETAQGRLNTWSQDC